MKVYVSSDELWPHYFLTKEEEENLESGGHHPLLDVDKGTFERWQDVYDQFYAVRKEICQAIKRWDEQQEELYRQSDPDGADGVVQAVRQA